MNSMNWLDLEPLVSIVSGFSKLNSFTVRENLALNFRVPYITELSSSSKVMFLAAAQRYGTHRCWLTRLYNSAEKSLHSRLFCQIKCGIKI